MKRLFVSIILITTVIFSNLAFTLTPITAQAGVVSKFSSCATGGIVAPIIQGLINKAVSSVTKKITDSIKANISDAIDGAINAGLRYITFGILGGTQKVEDRAGIGVEKGILQTIVNKSYRDDVIARCLARQIMNGIINNTLEVARSGGRDGGSTFIRNWANFQTNSQYRGENVFRAMLSTAHLCDYFANDIKRSFGVRVTDHINLPGQNTRVDSLQPYSLETNCTLPTNFDLNKYQQDFVGNGGWSAWLKILEPQNNPYGVAFQSLTEIQKQRDLQQTADTNQVIANGGNLGISGNGKSDSCLVKAPTGTECIIYKDIKTPGNYITSSVGATVNAELNWLTNTQELNTIIANATEVMLNRLLNFGNPNEGSYMTVNDTDVQTSYPTPDPNENVSGWAETGNSSPSNGNPPPADANTRHPSQSATVDAVKAQLQSSGVNLSGECGAFEIVKNVAQQTGAGVLAINSGNGCNYNNQLYSSDNVVYPDGYVYDILYDAGGANGPQWNFNGTTADCSYKNCHYVNAP
jgi:hypothetical protein